MRMDNTSSLASYNAIIGLELEQDENDGVNMNIVIEQFEWMSLCVVVHVIDTYYIKFVSSSSKVLQHAIYFRR